MALSYQEKILSAKTSNAKELIFDALDGSSSLTSIPNEVFSLKTLEILDLYKIQLNEMPAEILKLENLSDLKIGESKIKKFPVFLKALPKLKQLTFSSVELTNLPEELSEWTTLEYLSIPSCIQLKNIWGIPPNLKYLRLEGTILTELPKSLANLNLGKLVLDGTNFKKFPDQVFDINGLFALYLTNFKIPIPFEKFKTFINLNELWLIACNIYNLPIEITNLSLYELVIYGNLLQSFPPELSRLKNLQKLDFGSNNFAEIPKVVFELKELRHLNFGNYYDECSFKNKITKIPDEVLSLKKLKQIDYFLNPIENIPVVFLKDGVKAIKNYIQSTLESENEEFLYEAKMVMVGRGYVGKTALTKKLTDPEYQLVKENSTCGISILKNPFQLKISGLQNDGLFRFNIWDFGGQEKYDATHQLFITNRSVYLFITEAREESNYLDFYYWLNTIQLFSNNSPVIIVLSKIDERKKLLPENLYKDKFQNIVSFVDVSCASGYEHTIESLKKAISEAVNQLPQTHDKLSKRWIDIRNDLEKLSEKHDFISYEEYLNVCTNHKLNTTKADYLSLYLNDLGVIIHHQQDLLLKKTIFLNTDWCVDGLYAVLDSQLVYINKGKFTESDLGVIWSDPRFQNKQPELLKLMQRYELCFKLKDNSGFLAPDLLPVDRSSEIQWNNDSNLKFEIRYDFMPAGMLARFIVKSHSFIKEQLYWKYGVILEYDNTVALVEEDYIHSKILISLQGENKKGLLSAIRMFIEEVHRDFDKANKLEFQEMVPCNCAACKRQIIPHFYKFAVLRKFESLSKNTISCENSGNDVKVRALINDIQIGGYDEGFDTTEDLHSFLLAIISEVLEKEIRQKDGFNNFWRDSTCIHPKNEIEFQPYITNTIDRECKVRGIQVSREVREANGSVDVLFSYTNKAQKILKVCLEIKKAHHDHVDTAIATQLPGYMESAGTDYGIYLVLWFKNTRFKEPNKFKNEKELLQTIQLNNQKNPFILPYIINCSKKPSPSKIKMLK